MQGTDVKEWFLADGHVDTKVNGFEQETRLAFSYPRLKGQPLPVNGNYIAVVEKEYVLKLQKPLAFHL